MNIALIIFVLTYIIIGIQNIPKLHINRPAGALLNAVNNYTYRVKDG